MSKIGEEKTPPPEPTKETYRKQLDQSVLKFENALESYQITGDAEQKAQLKGIMDQQLGLIRSAVREIYRGDIRKKETDVEADYKRFIQNPSKENTIALEQDLDLLRDYNRE